MNKVCDYLLSQQNIKYRNFTLSLIPNVEEKTFIGVRLPVIKKYAKDLPEKDRLKFLKELPHKYHEESIY